MRHPFERLVSAYRHKSFQKQIGLGKLSFEEFLQEKVIKVVVVHIFVNNDLKF